MGIIYPLDAEASASRSHHRREMADRRLGRIRRLRAALAAPALIGAVVAASELTQPVVDSTLVIVAALAVVPFLATFDLLRMYR